MLLNVSASYAVAGIDELVNLALVSSLHQMGDEVMIICVADHTA